MTTRDELKPAKKFLVIDLLKSLGMDVSAWARFKGGAARAASNPKFCYNWSFIQPGEFIVICLWYRGLRSEGQRLYYEIKRGQWGTDRTEPGTGSINKRSNDLDRHIWQAFSQQLPVRVIFVNESPREDAKVKVASRLLDEVPWAVTSYDLNSGQCILERGVKPVPRTINAEDLELSGFEGAQRVRFVIHRRREGELRRRKIEEAMLKTGKLICEVPKCGFDFERRYGDLGKGYAQVHHLVPLHKAPADGRKVTLDDLAIVCANCHAMIHAGGECRPLAGLIR